MGLDFSIDPEAWMAAYLIAEHSISDAERFEEHRSKVATMIERPSATSE